MVPATNESKADPPHASALLNANVSKDESKMMAR